MTNTYRALSILAKSQHGDAPVDLDLSVMEERDALDSGHLELVPRKYRILSGNYQAGKQGDVVELALLKENESALFLGGHLERVAEPTPEPELPTDSPPKKAATK